MTENQKSEIIKNYYEKLPKDISFEESAKRIFSIPDTIERSIIAESVCNGVIDDISIFWYGWKYPDGILLSEDYIIKNLFMPLLPYLPDDNKVYYNAVAAFFEGKIDKAFELLKKGIEEYISTGGLLDEYWFAYSYTIFKGSIPKLYDYILKRISKEKYEKGLPELIRATKIYYCSSNIPQLEKAASEALLILPDSILAKELMADVWYSKKCWENVIAILEDVENGYILAEHERLFMLAWAKSKTKDRNGAIEYYKKCLEIAPQKSWARNNLAYEYYVTKQYKKAEEEYHRCVEEKLDLKLACTGYVRTLVALGKYEKAEEFIKESQEKIYKHALDELKNAKSGKKKQPKESSEDNTGEELLEVRSIEHKPIFQFSKESILEDELTERLSSGSIIFGVPLKIYKRKGIYGRQWTFSGLGRIDLLAEDNDGNIYVIELKKDSGYDDAYAQTIKYVEWFEKSKYAEGKKVYGIICVNDPPKKLIKSIQNDDRIRLFEYKVSYTEIK